jgi:hypothetical protein
MPSWMDTLTPEAKAEHIAKMQAGRKNAREKKAGELVIAAPPMRADGNPIEGLRMVDWHLKTEAQLRSAIPLLDEAKERAAVRLRILVDKRTGESCGACGGPLPKTGRHFGEISWHDHEIHGIRVLRACAPGCYSKIQTMAEGIRRGAQELAHSRLSHA